MRTWYRNLRPCHLIVVMMCTSSGGCASINHWTEGVWIEECIETDKDDDCDWAADFLNPDQSYRYVFGCP